MDLRLVVRDFFIWPDKTTQNPRGWARGRAARFLIKNSELIQVRKSKLLAAMLSATASCHRGGRSSSHQRPDVLRSCFMRFYSEYAATFLPEGSLLDLGGL